MSSIDRRGFFYLGKKIDVGTEKGKNQPFFYMAKDFTTHAFCVGMTGSGKTGLGIAILEEAAINKIPCIVIDPKGDLTNLLLTFPQLSAEEFRPWVDSGEADQKGMTIKEYSEFLSRKWKEGLSSSDEDIKRITEFRDAVDISIYTPGNSAGIPISILNSFAAPPKSDRKDPALLREKISSLTASLLGLLGIDADPLKSKEHILISTIIQQEWEEGKDVDIQSLIAFVQRPPFKKIGALDIDTFYSEKERIALSIKLNNFLASPRFQDWIHGVPLIIDRFLESESGKPKISIITIAHLSDGERMFFVTLLLNELLTWMRGQSGTSGLRALFYMDEVFGFFPPVASPPSKLPMISLLKQARAFGIGIILATQNPVDLDYKGLSNCGTWFIGKLQTERDKKRVLEGLKTASNGELDSRSLQEMISHIESRTFIMRSIHEKEPILFQTRWTLSYLKGPLTLIQVEELIEQSSEMQHEKKSIRSPATKESSKKNAKPSVPAGIKEFFLVTHPEKGNIDYQPHIIGIGKVHFVDSKIKIDEWKEVSFAYRLKDHGIEWNEGISLVDFKNQLEKQSPIKGGFGELVDDFTKEKNFATYSKEFANVLYQNETLTLFKSNDPSIISKIGESEEDFRLRIADEVNAKKEQLLEKIREKYALKIKSQTEKIKRVEEKVEDQKQKKGFRIIETLLSFLSTILNAVMGKRLTKGTISQTGTSLRKATTIGKDSYAATKSENDLQRYREELEDLQSEKVGEIGQVEKEMNPLQIPLEKIVVRPRKSDVIVETIGLLWWG